MDTIDRKILAELQVDGRLTLSELADRVGLSVSPCHRRVKELEKSKAIVGYRTEISPEKVGLNFSALVVITIKEGDKVSLSKLEQAVDAIPQITNAQRLFGTPDYLLHVVTKDLAAFQQLYDDKLSALPGVQRLTSTIVMKDIVRARNLHF